MKVIEVTPTISTSIYAAGDAAADYAGGPSNSVATKSNLNMPYVPAGTISIWATLHVRGTPTYVATDDLTVKLFVEES